MNIGSKPKGIEFNRPTKYGFIKELGSGACGATVLLRDEGMNCEFVAKKYRPIVTKDDDNEMFQELLRRFRDEARILFRLNHPNVVRVFNYYDYPEFDTAYILMEHVSGDEFLDFLKNQPSDVDRIFEGVVDGFAHLETMRVLHRDIRPANIMVDRDGVPKIIDFGFGKQLEAGSEDLDAKSISLNWWCDTPPEFQDGIYDFQTEVYFIGKLFQLAINEIGLSGFKYRILLGNMCEPDRQLREQSFHDVQSKINRGKFEDLDFSAEEIATYREFADELLSVVSSVSSDARFERDVAKLLAKLESLYRSTMLEESLSAPNKLVSLFVLGAFR